MTAGGRAYRYSCPLGIPDGDCHAIRSARKSARCDSAAGARSADAAVSSLRLEQADRLRRHGGLHGVAGRAPALAGGGDRRAHGGLRGHCHPSRLLHPPAGLPVRPVRAGHRAARSRLLEHGGCGTGRQQHPVPEEPRHHGRPAVAIYRKHHKRSHR